MNVTFKETGGSKEDRNKAITLGLKVGESYKVLEKRVYPYTTYYDIEGFEGSFNSCMFEEK